MEGHIEGVAQLANGVAGHVGILCIQNLQTVHSIDTIFNNAEIVKLVW